MGEGPGNATMQPPDPAKVVHLLRGPCLQMKQNGCGPMVGAGVILVVPDADIDQEPQEVEDHHAGDAVGAPLGAAQTA